MLSPLDSHFTLNVMCAPLIFTRTENQQINRRALLKQTKSSYLKHNFYDYRKLFFCLLSVNLIFTLHSRENATKSRTRQEDKKARKTTCVKYRPYVTAFSQNPNTMTTFFIPCIKYRATKGQWDRNVTCPSCTNWMGTFSTTVNLAKDHSMNGWRSLSCLLLSLLVFGRETRQTSWSGAPSPIRQIIQLDIYRLDNLVVALSRPNDVLLSNCALKFGTQFDGCQYGKMPDNVPIGISLLTGFVHLFLKPYCHFSKRNHKTRAREVNWTGRIKKKKEYLPISYPLRDVCTLFA